LTEHAAAPANRRSSPRPSTGEARLLPEGAGRGDPAAELLATAAVPAACRRAAAWVEGFLAGDASLLLHDRELLGVLDDWVAAVRGTVFDEVLPVLRRTFATFPAPERRALGSHLRRLDEGGGDPSAGNEETLDWERAALVLPRLRELLGATGP